MSVPAPRRPSHANGRWETIRYALDSNARTVRLCLILLVTIVAPVAAAAVAVLIHHVLLCDRPPARVPGLIRADIEDLGRLNRRARVRRKGCAADVMALEEQRNGEWRYLEFLQATSLITADIFLHELPGGTRARHRPRPVGTCPKTDTDHSDQSVPVLFAPLFLEGRFIRRLFRGG